MDNLPQRLKDLAKNRVFAVTAVIFFAFLTAFMLVLLTSQSKNASIEDLRAQLQGGSPQSNQPGQNQPGTNTGTGGGTGGQGSSETGGTGGTGDASGAGGSAAGTGGSTPQQKAEVAANSAIAQIVKNAAPLPKVQIGQLELKTSYPAIPEKVNVYNFRTNYSEQEAVALAGRLGIASDLVEHTGDTTTIVDRQGSVVSFDKKTGAFFYTSPNGLRPTVSSTAPTTQAANFLKQIGVYDDTLIFTSVYKSADAPNSQFVEFHRDWNKVGFPIYDLLGIYNLPASRSVKSIRLGEIDPNAPAGSRGNYFNTATVEVDTTGAVKSVTSTLRRIQNTITVDKSQIRTPQDALAEAQAGRAIFSLSVPTGTGFIDISKLYPGQQAIAANVPITDFVAAYWENNSNAVQADLTPYYLLCGNTTLSSGYGSRICHVVPVLLNTNSVVLGAHTTLLSQNTGPLDKPLPTQISAGKGDSLQYGTFGFTGTTTETGCPLSFTNSYKVGPGQYIAWEHQPPPKSRRWYWVLTNDAGAQSVQTNSSGTVVGPERSRLQGLRADAWRKCKPRLPNVCAGAPTGAEVKGCYFLYEGSPAIYLYPTTKQSVSVRINPLGGTAYAHPDFTSAAETLWAGVGAADGSIRLTNGLIDNRLYYEFKRDIILNTVKQSHRSTRAFVVKRNELGSFISTFATQVGLTAQEQVNLYSELERELNTESGNTFRISLVNQSILDNVLPLSISPTPQTIHRIMLYVEKAQSSDNAQAPQLERITRNGFTVVETGVLIDSQ